MTRRTFALSGFRHYARTNIAVIAGVAIAVAVLTGALIVGDSVRGSLRRLALQRLGNTSKVLAGPLFFRDALGGEMGGTPLIALEGVVSKQDGRQRAGGVAVYGVDDRFWKFHGKAAPAFASGEALISPGLAEELGAKSGDTVLIRIEKPSAIPRESLHGRKEDAGRTIRLSTAAILPREDTGEFALKPTQGAIKAVFVNLRRLQRDLEQTGKTNAVLFDGNARPDLSKVPLSDMGIRLIPAQDGLVSVETESAVISDSLEAAIGGAARQKFFTYLVNSMRAPSGREVPYSLVTAVSGSFLDVPAGGIALNDWAARDLGVKPGEPLTLDYYLWDSGGSLLTRTAAFRVSAIVPTKDDRTLAPSYPGITESSTLADWDPPFPMDLKKVRPVDEEYWKKYRTTPKAFVNIDDGRKLWGSRFGHLTSVRVPGDAVAGLRQKIQPSQVGLTLVDIRALTLDASKGSTDFGEYFLYFSFFLVVSALLLTSVFFQLNVDQRLREIGLLRALGFSSASVRTHLLREGLPLAAIGSLLGIALGVGYAAFILYGLRTWWRGAVGTSELTLSFHADALAAGVVMGIATGALTILLSLRALRKASPRDLLSGSRGVEDAAGISKKTNVAAVVCVLLAVVVILAIPASGAFFGSGFLLLTAGILAIRNWLRSRKDTVNTLNALGVRNAAWKPNRSAMCVTLIAVAVFLLISLEAFRQGESHGEDGSGITMLAESQLPVVHDLNTAAGREAMALQVTGNRFYPFRLKPGDDASCLNLYEPRNPRVIGASGAFLKSNRMPGPWDLLLATKFEDGAAPAIADANSMMYVLHKKVGDTMTLPDGAKLRFVGALSGSVLQAEIVIAEQDFIRLFPQEQGFRFFLIEGPVSNAAALEEQLSDFGFDVVTVAQKLASFHAVESTYLSTFQALGALGLLLGIAGLSAVLMRNVFERRKEMALLRAVGMQASDLSRLVIAENAMLVAAGVGLGALCALVAVFPAMRERGLHGLPVFAIALLVLAVSGVSLLASLAAIRFVQKLPLLESLRSEQA